jgi:hypothetical protein
MAGAFTDVMDAAQEGEAMEIREITWEDTGQHMAQGWTSLDIIKERAQELSTLVKTIGYVLEYNDDFVLIGQNVDTENGNVAGVMRIARSSIKEITTPSGRYGNG